MKRLSFFSLIVAAAMLMAADNPSNQSKSAPKPDPSAAKIQKWIKQLGNESYRVREEATRRLIVAEEPVIPAITIAIKSKDAEIRQRAKSILHKISITLYCKKVAAIRSAMKLKQAENNHEKLLKIEKNLRTKVTLNFNEKPLQDVLKDLAEAAQINILIDTKGLSEQGVELDTPVTINLHDKISLKSALNLIMAPLDLDFEIHDEVIRVSTSRELAIITREYDLNDFKLMDERNNKPNRMEFWVQLCTGEYKIEQIPKTSRFRVTMTQESHYSMYDILWHIRDKYCPCQEP